MSHSSKTRRDFLRSLALAACSGGTAAMFPQLRMMGSALANTRSLPGYKALVCVYLAGGNDSWNLLVPFDAARHEVYADARGGVYNAQSNPDGLALGIPGGVDIALQRIVDGNDASSVTNQYFVHPKFAALADLYRAGNLAFAVNVGTLVKPIVKADYSIPANRPPQSAACITRGVARMAVQRGQAPSPRTRLARPRRACDADARAGYATIRRRRGVAAH
jgi:uncharacterized protein (DUF1501 family)